MELNSLSDVRMDRRKDGSTPLHLASKNGHKSIVTLLIKKGAVVNTRNNRGSTPLDIAGCSAVALLLLKRGAEITAFSNCKDWNPGQQADHIRELYNSIAPEDEFQAASPEHLDVCFGEESHWGTKKWHKVIQLFVVDRKIYSCWRDKHCDDIQDRLYEKYGIERFLVRRGASGKALIKRATEQSKRTATWYVATTQEVLNRTKRQFLDDRKQQSSSANYKVAPTSSDSQASSREESDENEAFDETPSKSSPARSKRQKLDSSLSNDDESTTYGDNIDEKPLAVRACKKQKTTPSLDDNMESGTKLSSPSVKADEAIASLTALQAQCQEAIKLHQSNKVAAWASNSGQFKSAR